MLGQGVTVCAIGDVHGKLGHVQALAQWLAAQALKEEGASRHLVLIGDYVDRGENSLGVLEFVHGLKLPGIEVTALWGNHDLFLHKVLNDPACTMDFVDFWRSNGGDTTLAELGITAHDLQRTELLGLQQRLVELMPPHVPGALKRLQFTKRIGPYLFVHAGLHPTRKPDLDDIEQIVQIREPFLSGTGWKHDFVAVHGHTICGPDVRPHRIAVDSGAFATGILTAVVLRQDRLRFVAATANGSMSELPRGKYLKEITPRRWARVMQALPARRGTHRIS